MDFVDILKNIGFLIEGTLFLALAFMVYGFKIKMQGADLHVLLTERDNPAVSVSVCGFLFGCIIAYTGSISTSSSSFWIHINDVAKFSIIILILQVLADVLADRFLFNEFSFKDEIVTNRNVAVALGQAAVSVATGFILAGAFSTPANGILLSIIWFIIGQVLLIAVTKVYQVQLTPYNDMKEIKNQNLAAGFALSGVLIAVGYTVSHAIEGEFQAWAPDFIAVVLYIAFSLVVLVLMRFFTDKILLPGANINDEIARDKNIGAGLLEGTVYILAAMIIAFFLT